MTPQLHLSAEKADRLLHGRYTIGPDDGEDNLGDCPYYARYESAPGHDPDATCAYGCVDEPECVTCCPSGGWPVPSPLLPIPQPIPCPTCGGDGRAADKLGTYPCPDCSDGWYRGTVELVVECEHNHESSGWRVSDNEGEPVCFGRRKIGSAVIDTVLPVVAIFPDDDGARFHAGNFIVRSDTEMIVYVDQGNGSTDVSHLLPVWDDSSWAYVLTGVQP